MTFSPSHLGNPVVVVSAGPTSVAVSWVVRGLLFGRWYRGRSVAELWGGDVPRGARQLRGGSSFCQGSEPAQKEQDGGS